MVDRPRENVSASISNVKEEKKIKMWQYDIEWKIRFDHLKVLGKSVGLCKTRRRKDQLYILFLYGESSVKISTQTDSY